MDNLDATRVIYAKNPLDEVNCQLRFPPILKIDAEVPAAFQERIRADFPLYEIKSSIKLPADLPKSFATVIQRDMPIPGSKYHSFGAADRLWSIRLARDCLALACRKYERWENFRARLLEPFESLLDVYQPAYFSHICLKYRDVIRRKRLGLESVPWSDLLEPWVSGPLSHKLPECDVEGTQTTAVILLPDGLGKVHCTLGLGIDEPTKESVFVIDSHIYSEPRTEPTDVFKHLDAINRQAGVFFRRCIADRLHEALQPGSP